ncbi:hypothetical protein [Sanguibacter sp. 25GB23B1]|uniref:hypothetical protein n=1 Tax=unclassified Sanguibacter TaxID=2645534 RepID=UPI0032AF4482
MNDEQASGASRQVSVALLADPGRPLRLAQKVAPELPELLAAELGDDVEWVVSAEEYWAPLDDAGVMHLAANVADVRKERGRDYLIYLSDLPRYELDEPVVATVNTSYGGGMVAVPALGLSRASSVCRLLVRMVGRLHSDPGDHDGTVRADTLLQRVATVDADPQGIDPEGPGSQDTVRTLKGVLGRVVVLAGMVRSSSPLRLVPRLSSAMAGAIATAAFGIFYTSIWSMADYLSAGRLLVISLLSVVTMTVWLIASHGLWEAPEGDHRRERRILYNAATVTSVLIAVATMFLALFAVVLLGALVVIDVDYLEENIRDQAGFLDYVSLAWLASSMGTIGGAVGASFSDAEVVRRATFSNREFARRQTAQGWDDE